MRRACVVLLLGLAACRPSASEPHQQAPSNDASPAPKEPSTSMTSFDPSAWDGRCVIAQGYAQGQKIGAALNLGGPMLGVIFENGDSQWSAPLGVRVRVKGRIAQRADLPVFVQEPGEPIMQGISVPPGTDVEQARRRWVIEQAEATVIRTPEQVEAELGTHVGESVALGGILWSRNGAWWFSHEGVDVHVERSSTLEFQQHGEVVMLRGKLSRRSMPRIDQLGIASEPELAEAFVLRVDSIEPHPTWAIEACPEAE